jgi:ABC-2 type transport system permease protein
MRALMTVHAIVVRDVSRAVRQKSRLLGGLARPFMWLLLVGTGYSTIVHVEGARSYHAFVFPGIIVMAALFGAMLTAISTVYDREFGMLRLMLASPAGVPAVLAGRAIAAAAVGMLQGGVVLLCLPLVVSATATQLAAATAALVLGATASGVLQFALFWSTTSFFDSETGLK